MRMRKFSSHNRQIKSEERKQAALTNRRKEPASSKVEDVAKPGLRRAKPEYLYQGTYLYTTYLLLYTIKPLSAVGFALALHYTTMDVHSMCELS